MADARPDYVELTYSAERLPPSDYPGRLAARVASRAFPRPGSLLDVGCGRGEYVKAFAALGFKASGVDSAASAAGFAPGLDIRRADLDSEPFPFPDASFDCVFSKSVVEHLARPERALAECVRVLKPGGVAVVMTPSWRHTQRIFFEDFGHIRPFGANALSDALTLAGLDGVKVEYLRQLPALWEYPALEAAAALTALFPLPYRPWDRAPWPEGLNKWIRFSKEVMLVGVGRKGGS